MAGGNSKFLVQLMQGFTNKQVFFAVWFAIVGGFVLAIMAYYRKYTRSNFRRPEDGPGPRIDVHARKLGTGNQNTQVSVKENKGAALKKR